jgi:hypothetical protein
VLPPADRIKQCSATAELMCWSSLPAFILLYIGIQIIWTG